MGIFSRHRQVGRCPKVTIRNSADMGATVFVADKDKGHIPGFPEYYIPPGKEEILDFSKTQLGATNTIRVTFEDGKNTKIINEESLKCGCEYTLFRNDKKNIVLGTTSTESEDHCERAPHLKESQSMPVSRATEEQQLVARSKTFK